MRYLATLRSSQPPTPPPPGLMEAIMELGAEAVKAGVLLDTAGLAPSAVGGARITVSGGEISVTDGPFAETKEMISYAIYDVRDRAEAVEWTSRFLKLHRDLWPGWEGEGDVLQVFGGM
ncbi:YciI family protein [Rhizohabitans arisaemae]|uniref:YciI family protein n=1 Tax=Rhizohabitans arisaemae TaxID=2720610 RepID=UPI0024B14989|nr:YciI family protein [Rhizohabitans arisaemae]